MKKITGALVCSLLVSFLFPASSGVDINMVDMEVTSASALDFVVVSHVVAQGTGTIFISGSNFILGFGVCALMIVNLEEDGHIEINSLLDTSENITVDGSHNLFMLGFFGFQSSRTGVNINGIVLFTLLI